MKNKYLKYKEMNSLAYSVIFLMLICCANLFNAQTYSKSILVNLGSNSCGSTTPYISLTDKSVPGNPLILDCNVSSTLGDLNDAFVEYDAKDNYIYLAKRFTNSTRVWRYDVGLPTQTFACPTLGAPTYTYNFRVDNFSIDQGGDVYSISGYNSTSATATFNKFNIATGVTIINQTVQFPLANKPQSLGSGDMTFVADGKMYAVFGSAVNGSGATTASKLYEITNYGSTTGNATAVFLKNIPKAVYGIAFINNQLQLSGFDSSSCYSYLYDIASSTLSSVSTFSNGDSPVDDTSIYTSIGSTKRLLKNTTINSNTSDLEYELYLQNTGNVKLQEVQLTDDLGSIFGAANISNLSTSIINPATDNPSGLTLNPSYNGTTNKNLLNPGQALTNNITSNYIKILLKFRVTNVIVGKAYTNQGQASGYVGTPANHVTVSDFTNNGPPPSIYPLGNDGFSTYSYDSDHDGIGDLDDLDEDNDGILDVDEMGICSPTSGVTSLSGFNGILYDIPNTNSWALLSGATSFPAASYTKLATFDYNELAGTNKALSINYQGDGTSLSTNPKISNFIGSNIPNDGGEDYAIYFSKTISSVEAGKYQFDLDYGDDHVFLYKNNVKVYQLQNAYGSTTNNGLASITNVATLTLNPGDVLTYVVAEENVGNTAIKFLTTKLSQVDGSAARCIVDSDNDGIPDYLDVDSDNDGCPDAVEGSENVIVDQVYPLTLALTDPNYNLRGQIKVTYDGTTTNTPPNIISNTPASLGVPQLVNNAGNNLNTVSNPSNLAGVADNTDVPGPTTADIGQGVGSSIDKTVNSCICYNLPNLTGTATGTKQGITLLKRAGADNGNWPMNRNSGLTALESNTKGFVITRLTTAQIGTLVSPQEGMMVYDSTAKCLKLYDGTAWSCFNTPTCP